MGSGIAQLIARHGFSVTLYDPDAAALARAREKIGNDLETLIKKKRIAPAHKEETLERIHFSDDIRDCAAAIVIEAIVEDEKIKTDLFRQLSAVNSRDTIFATNTSSLSVASLAAQTDRPDRFAGMHFFNPATIMKLVEIVKAPLTSDETVGVIRYLAEASGKSAVICKDSPGFIVNHVARPYYLEPLHLVEHNIGQYTTIDELLEATGFKMGPFRLMDLIGNDVNSSVSKIVYEALGRPERLKPSSIQTGMVGKGLLGRKTGKGYYEYPAT